MVQHIVLAFLGYSELSLSSLKAGCVPLTHRHFVCIVQGWRQRSSVLVKLVQSSRFCPKIWVGGEAQNHGLCRGIAVQFWVREQLAGSFFPLCGSLGLNSGYQAWQQAPMFAEPSCHPWPFLFSNEWEEDGEITSLVMFSLEA